MDVDLNDQELSLWNQISNYQFKLGDHEENDKQSNLQKQLTHSILKRKIIPPRRLAFFTDPELRAGHGNGSWQEIFESNGTRGDEIFEHPHFLPFLKYFISGAELTTELKQGAQHLYEKTAFKQDYPDLLYTLATQRKYLPINKWEMNNYAEEIYKLLLDFNVPSYNAKTIRTKVMSRKK
jgi:hypothetical protein